MDDLAAAVVPYVTAAAAAYGAAVAVPDPTSAERSARVRDKRGIIQTGDGAPAWQRQSWQRPTGSIRGTCRGSLLLLGRTEEGRRLQRRAPAVTEAGG